MEKQKFILGDILNKVYSSDYHEANEQLKNEKQNLYNILDRLLANDYISMEEYHDFENGFNIEYREFLDFLNVLDMNINIILPKFEVDIHG